MRLSCRTGDPDELLKRLAQRELDLVLTDRQPESGEAGRFRTYRLASSSMSLFGTPELAEAIRPQFPASLDGQPFLATSLSITNWAPSPRTSWRRSRETDWPLKVRRFCNALAVTFSFLTEKWPGRSQAPPCLPL